MVERDVMKICNKCGKVIRCCEDYCPCGGEYIDERDMQTQTAQTRTGTCALY